MERKRSPSLSVVDVVARLGTSGLGILFAESPTDNSWIFANEPQWPPPTADKYISSLTWSYRQSPTPVAG